MAWGFDDFAGVENEGFEIHDFVFKLNFLGFLCAYFLRKFLGMNPRNMNMFFRKKIMKEINFFNLIILFYFKRI